MFHQLFSFARRVVFCRSFFPAGLLAAFVGFLAASPTHAQVVTFTATDSAAKPGITPVNSNAAAAQFDTAAGTLGTENLVTFEAVPVGTFTSLAIAPGVTLTGADYQGNPQSIANSPSYPAQPEVAGFDTTVGGSQYLFIQGGTAVFTFVNPIQAFGAYFTGIQPGFFQDTINFSDGSSQSINVASATSLDGGVSFTGFTDAGKSISKITINAGPNASGADFIGLDDLRFVPSSSPVPEASTTTSLGLLLAFGLCGLIIAAKRKKASSSL